MLITDQVATAPCTDLISDFEAKLSANVRAAEIYNLQVRHCAFSLPSENCRATFAECHRWVSSRAPSPNWNDCARHIKV